MRKREGNRKLNLFILEGGIHGGEKKQTQNFKRSQSFYWGGLLILDDKRFFCSKTFENFSFRNSDLINQHPPIISVGLCWILSVFSTSII